MAHRFVMEGEKRTEAVNLNVKTETALSDLNGRLVAALCVVRFDEQYADMEEEDKKHAVETLLEFCRGVLDDAKEGHEGVWRITAEYIFATKSEQPEAESEQPKTQA
jgi:hypothetical protein